MRKELGRIEPPIPKVDVINEFIMSVFKGGGGGLKYGIPFGVAGNGGLTPISLSLGLLMNCF